MPSSFVYTFTKPLITSRPQSPILSRQELSAIASVSEETERKQTLRTLLVTLNDSPSRRAVGECIESLVQLQSRQSTLIAAQDIEEEALKNTVACKLLVSLYAHALDTHLGQAMQAEAEADWWADTERSNMNLLMYLVQSMSLSAIFDSVQASRARLSAFPLRLANLVQTIIQALHDRQLPIRVSAFTPRSLRQLFPSTKTFQPGAMTIALFPHLQHQPLSITASTLLYPSLKVRKPKDFANTITVFISNCMQYVTSLVTLPIELCKQECRYKRKELESIRNQCAEVLGRLALLRGALTSIINTQPSELQSITKQLEETVSRKTTTQAGAQIEASSTATLLNIIHLSSSLSSCENLYAGQVVKFNLKRPPAIVLLWPKFLLLPPLFIYTLRYAYASRASIAQVIRDARQTAEGFIRGWLIEPLKDVLRTVRAGGEDGVIIRREAVAADLNSLERMALSLAKDELCYGPEQLHDLAEKIRVGDLTPILELYEEDIKHPLKSAMLGTLLRSMFIQVQKAKVDIDQTLTGIDKLLKSQELTFAFVGFAPALTIVYLLGGAVTSFYLGGRGQGRYGGKAKRFAVWTIMRRIERLLISQPNKNVEPEWPQGEGSSSAISPLTSGLLLLAVAQLRMFAEVDLPAGSRLQEGFMDDVSDLEDPELGRMDKLSVVNRMWRCWGTALGWNTPTIPEYS
ncbi:hypothetical protein AMATHDRAFT_136509 [Amanita thiersii Skay4041]|uniref:NCA2-domain-containing protein n=1 Tax=Amanita thiersii Skay4041 TaxID=703135 RepID=A0A2A9NZI5_9AGAR|nr:hypothetical protein AMATHDRAFT_136509 [Amanita thiersii Skay4041]